MNLRLLLDRKNWEKLFFVYRHNKNNSKMEMAYNHYDASIKVYGFYHAYCMCDNWELLVEEQLKHIRESGLYNRMDKLFMGVLINSESIAKLTRIVSDYPKIEILYTNVDRTLFEYPTLMKMQQKCREETFIGFYFHTKGISWINKPKVYNVGNTWRLMAEYFMFDKYKIAIHSLVLGGADVYGTNYQKIFNNKFRIIGGNFFWFRSDYVSGLYTLQVNKSDRNESEKWILSNTCNVYCPFYFSGNSRNDAIPSELYMPSKKYVRLQRATVIYFKRFVYLFRRLLGLKVDLINLNGIVHTQNIINQKK